MRGQRRWGYLRPQQVGCRHAKGLGQAFDGYDLQTRPILPLDLLVVPISNTGALCQLLLREILLLAVSAKVAGKDSKGETDGHATIITF